LEWVKSNSYIQNRIQTNGDLRYSYKDLLEYLRHLV
jgi:hypothetical protein